VQVDDVGGHVIQEVAVVGHHHQRLLPPHQVLLQPQHLPRHGLDLDKRAHLSCMCRSSEYSGRQHAIVNEPCDEMSHLLTGSLEQG